MKRNYLIWVTNTEIFTNIFWSDLTTETFRHSLTIYVTWPRTGQTNSLVIFGLKLLFFRWISWMG